MPSDCQLLPGMSTRNHPVVPSVSHFSFVLIWPTYCKLVMVMVYQHVITFHYKSMFCNTTDLIMKIWTEVIKSVVTSVILNHLRQEFGDLYGPMLTSHLQTGSSLAYKFTSICHIRPVQISGTRLPRILMMGLWIFFLLYYYWCITYQRWCKKSYFSFIAFIPFVP
jgi:hypothetical protein